MVSHKTKCYQAQAESQDASIWVVHLPAPQDAGPTPLTDNIPCWIPDTDTVTSQTVRHIPLGDPGRLGFIGNAGHGCRLLVTSCCPHKITSAIKKLGLHALDVLQSCKQAVQTGSTQNATGLLKGAVQSKCTLMQMNNGNQCTSNRSRGLSTLAGRTALWHIQGQSHGAQSCM
jgi:hypothetical protein